jgi:hypothetical protein
MNVNIVRLHAKDDDITNLINRLGNVPKCAIYVDGEDEDEREVIYVFCIDANVNIQDLCKEYNVAWYRHKSVTIDQSHYNNNYEINFYFDVNYNNPLRKIKKCEFIYMLEELTEVQRKLLLKFLM